MQLRTTLFTLLLFVSQSHAGLDLSPGENKAVQNERLARISGKAEEHSEGHLAARTQRVEASQVLLKKLLEISGEEAQIRTIRAATNFNFLIPTPAQIGPIAEQLLAGFSQKHLLTGAKFELGRALMELPVRGDRKDFFKPLLEKHGKHLIDFYLSGEGDEKSRETLLAFLRNATSSSELVTLFGERLSKASPLPISNVYALEALEKLGKPSKPYVDPIRSLLATTLLKSKLNAASSSSIAAAAAKALGAIGDDTAKEELTQLAFLNQVEPRWTSARREAILALGKMGNMEEISKLAPLLHPSQPQGVQDAVLEVLNLQESHTPLSAPLAANLELATKSEDADASRNAFSLLAKRTHGEQAEKTAAYFRRNTDEEADMFQRAHALEHYGTLLSKLPADSKEKKAGMETLKSISKAGPIPMRKRAIRSLHSVADPNDLSVQTTLENLAKDPSLEVRLETFLALHQRDGIQLNRALIEEGLKSPKNIERTLEILNSINLSSVSDIDIIRFIGTAGEKAGPVLKKWVIDTYRLNPNTHFLLKPEHSAVLLAAIQSITAEDDLALTMSLITAGLTNSSNLDAIAKVVKAHPKPEPLIYPFANHLMKGVGEDEKVDPQFLGFLLSWKPHGETILNEALATDSNSSIKNAFSELGDQSEEYFNNVVAKRLKTASAEDKDKNKNNKALGVSLEGLISSGRLAVPEIHQLILENLGKGNFDNYTEGLLGIYAGRIASKNPEYAKVLTDRILKASLESHGDSPLTHALIAMGESGSPVLKSFLKSENHSVQFETLKRMSSLDGKSLEPIIPELAAILSKSESQYKKEKDRALLNELKGGSKSPPAIEPVDLKRTALQLVSKIRKPSQENIDILLPAVATRLEGNSARSAISVLELTFHGVPEARPHLARMVGLPDRGAALDAAYALVINPEGQKLLATELVKKSEADQNHIANELHETCELLKIKFIPELEQIITPHVKTGQILSR